MKRVMSAKPSVKAAIEALESAGNRGMESCKGARGMGSCTGAREGHGPEMPA